MLAQADQAETSEGEFRMPALPCGLRPVHRLTDLGEFGKPESKPPTDSLPRDAWNQIVPNCPEGHPRQPGHGGTAISPSGGAKQTEPLADCEPASEKRKPRIT